MIADRTGILARAAALSSAMTAIGMDDGPSTIIALRLIIGVLRDKIKDEETLERELAFLLADEELNA